MLIFYIIAAVVGIALVMEFLPEVLTFLAIVAVWWLSKKNPAIASQFISDFKAKIKEIEDQFIAHTPTA